MAVPTPVSNGWAELDRLRSVVESNPGLVSPASWNAILCAQEWLIGELENAATPPVPERSNGGTDSPSNRRASKTAAELQLEAELEAESMFSGLEDDVRNGNVDLNVRSTNTGPPVKPTKPSRFNTVKPTKTDPTFERRTDRPASFSATHSPDPRSLNMPNSQQPGSPMGGGLPSPPPPVSPRSDSGAVSKSPPGAPSPASEKRKSYNPFADKDSYRKMYEQPPPPEVASAPNPSNPNKPPVPVKPKSNPSSPRAGAFPPKPSQRPSVPSNKPGRLKDAPPPPRPAGGMRRSASLSARPSGRGLAGPTLPPQKRTQTPPVSVGASAYDEAPPPFQEEAFAPPPPSGDLPPPPPATSPRSPHVPAHFAGEGRRDMRSASMGSPIAPALSDGSALDRMNAYSPSPTQDVSMYATIRSKKPPPPKPRRGSESGMQSSRPASVGSGSSLNNSTASDIGVANVAQRAINRPAPSRSRSVSGDKSPTAARSGLARSLSVGKNPRQATRKIGVQKMPSVAGGLAEFISTLTSHDFAMVDVVLDTLPRVEMEKLIPSFLGVVDEHEAVRLVCHFITREVTKTVQVTTVLRGNTDCSRLLAAFASKAGADFLRRSLANAVRAVILVTDAADGPTPQVWNVDALRNLPDSTNAVADTPTSVPECLAGTTPAQFLGLTATQQASAIAQMVINDLYRASEWLPNSFLYVCSHLAATVNDTFGPESVLTPVVGFILLRFFCPAIFSPVAYGLLEEEAAIEVKQMLVKVARLVQTLGNRAALPPGEVPIISSDTVMNEFLETNTEGCIQWLEWLIAPRQLGDLSSDTTTDGSGFNVEDGRAFHFSVYRHLSELKGGLRDYAGPVAFDRQAYWDELKRAVLSLEPPDSEVAVALRDGLLAEHRRAAEAKASKFKRFSKYWSPANETYTMREVVGWLQANLSVCQDEDEAVNVANHLIAERLLFVEGLTPDPGSTLPIGADGIKFQEDVDTTTFNLRRIWRGQTNARDPITVVTSLLESMLTLFADAAYLGSEFDPPQLRKKSEFRYFEFDVCELQGVDLTGASQRVLACFFLNLYHLLFAHCLVQRGFPATTAQRKAFYNEPNYVVGGIGPLSLHEIKFGILRAALPKCNLKDSAGFADGDDRARFALTTRDVRLTPLLPDGTPYSAPLRVFHLADLNYSLEQAMSDYVGSKVQLRETKKKGHEIVVPKTFEWYFEDFAASNAGLLSYLRRYVNEKQANVLEQLSDQRLDVRVAFAPYDTSEFRLQVDLSHCIGYV